MRPRRWVEALRAGVRRDPEPVVAVLVALVVLAVL
jgi:hypothetical protein